MGVVSGSNRSSYASVGDSRAVDLQLRARLAPPCVGSVSTRLCSQWGRWASRAPGLSYGDGWGSAAIVDEGGVSVVGPAALRR